MPKKQNKVLTKTLYSYVEPANRQFAIRKAKSEKIPGGYSGYVNDLITRDRLKADKYRKTA